MLKKIFLFLIVIIQVYSFDLNQRLSYSDEVIYFSIILSNNQVVTIAGDDSYIVYRYGTQDEIMMEYPHIEAISWDKFTMDSYEFEDSQGYYLEFNTDRYNYRIFEEDYDGEGVVGMVVKDLYTDQTLEFLANKNTLVGSLENLLKLESIRKRK